MQCDILITFHSDWHIAASAGGGILADAVLVKDGQKIPYIPGRALKGALREGARLLGKCRGDLAKCENYYFGSGSSDHEVKNAGRIEISRGELPEDIYSLLTECDMTTREDYVRDMTTIRMQTAIEKNGVVKPQSLRSMECGIPGITFKATITSYSQAGDAWDRQYLASVCAAVKSIGAGKSRGLGQCSIRLVQDIDKVVLPEEWPVFEGGDDA